MMARSLQRDMPGHAIDYETVPLGRIQSFSLLILPIQISMLNTCKTTSNPMEINSTSFPHIRLHPTFIHIHIRPSHILRRNINLCKRPRRSLLTHWSRINYHHPINNLSNQPHQKLCTLPLQNIAIQKGG